MPVMNFIDMVRGTLGVIYWCCKPSLIVLDGILKVQIKTGIYLCGSGFVFSEWL